MGSIIDGNRIDVCWFGNETTFYPIAGNEPYEEDIKFMTDAREALPYWLQEIKKLQETEKQLNQAMRNILTVTKDSGAWTTGARVAFVVNDTFRKVYGDEDKS